MLRIYGVISTFVSNTFNTNTAYKFDRGIYVDDRILINEILGMPKQRQNRFQMEY